MFIYARSIIIIIVVVITVHTDTHTTSCALARGVFPFLNTALVFLFHVFIRLRQLILEQTTNTSAAQFFLQFRLRFRFALFLGGLDADAELFVVRGVVGPVQRALLVQIL